MRAVALILGCTVVPAAASAAKINSEPPSFACRYGVYWTGVHIADLFGSFSAEQNTMQARIETYGLVQKISKYRSESVSRYVPDGQGLVSSTFHTNFRQRKVDRTIDLSYAKDGSLIKDSVVPPDNRAKRPAVDAALKPGTTDPLTAAVVARDKFQEIAKAGAEAGKSFSVRLYDGRRLSELSFTFAERLPAELPDEDGRGGSGGLGIVKFIMKRKAVQGYTGRELERVREEEPVITLFLDDQYFLPVRAAAAAPLGKVEIMREDCTRKPGN